MNKAEKRIAQKLLDNYYSRSNKRFTHEENLVLERWRVHGIINKDAFYDMTSHGSKGKEYGQNLNYPFTSFGDEEIKKDWYLKFRNSKMVVIIRDILTVVAFFLSLYIAIMNVIEK